MGEFASKGVAGAGLGLGIAGTALGVLTASGNGNGLLGGLFGGGNAQQQERFSAVIAENAMLKSENYADKVGKDTYAQSLADNRATEDRINAILGPTAVTIAELQKKVAVLETAAEKDKQITQLQIENCCCKMNGKIDAVAQAATCGIQQNSTAITNLQNLVNGFVKTVIPSPNVWTPPTTTTTTTTPAA